jgi:EAL domain-containing protein (putative c-di-GMP-specific phosphodiesterase class I)
VVAVEALARWHHPTRGLLAAGEFLGLAEDTGLITELGDRVMREACRQAARWVNEHPDLVLRVNVSARQLALPQFVGDVAEALVRAGLDASRLSIEIGETAIVGDLEGTLDALQRIRNLGVSIAIDDFGTGHSALSYLEQLPVEIVKIDRRYVSGLGSHGRDAVIVATLVRLGLALGLVVVAEGVETTEQRNELWELGCRRAQGYLFSRPRPANEITPFLGRSFALR